MSWQSDLQTRLEFNMMDSGDVVMRPRYLNAKRGEHRHEQKPRSHYDRHGGANYTVQNSYTESYSWKH